MTRLDQFESVFKAATKTVFEYRPVTMRTALAVTDLEDLGAAAFGNRVREFLRVLDGDRSLRWRNVAGSEYGSIRELLDLVEEEKPDLICTYRNLHSDAWKWPHSLGEYLDVLTQATAYPVLVLPHPEAGRELEHAVKNTDRVMAMTDHLTGDHRLVNHAVAFAQEKGTLYLAHVEDESAFERYMEVISKIPTIDTETAREEILGQLLKEPRDYIGSCREVLGEQGVPVRIEEIVTVGHRPAQYERLVEEHGVDLLVMNTKEEDQLAMHGLAHPLAIDLRRVPILML